MTYPPSPGEPLPPPVDPYDTPQHTAPLYHQPDYGQPTYVQPVYPATPPPLPPPPPSPVQGTSRPTVIVLLSVAIGLVLLMGGGAAIYLVGKSLSTTSTKQGGTASPSPESAKDSISIDEPDTLNGYDKLDADEFDSLTEDLEKEIEGYPGAANAFGAVYGSVAEKRLIAAFAAEVDIDDPQLMLDVVFQTFSGSNQLTDVTQASLGSLGGVAQCGTTRADNTDMALCGWADEGSVGMFLFFDETAVDVKGDFPDMRAEIETKD
ncbi:hypothetical protein [Actinoplanes sp. NPDC026670]|uniref:hypothetical protein n=1 Tax=Actinoplanes sp. NPDC026670 TaxID=3154700 RepID=UPI0033C95029